MKKIFNLLFVAALAFAFSACEKDNYDAPDSGLYGQVVDHHGNPLQTAVGQSSMKIQITELSWADGDESITVTNQNLNMKQDGSYYNNKLFAGTYKVLPLEGPFYPYDEEGKTVDLKGGKMTECNFEVIPYLEIEWVEEPYIAAGDTLKCSVRFTRNEKEGVAMPDVNNMQLYISHTQYCGTESDGRYTPGSTTIKNDQEGTIINLKSKAPINYSGTYWVRVGACCKDSYKKYNFTDIKKIEVK